MCVPSVSVRTFTEAVGTDVSKVSMLSKAENTEGRGPKKMGDQRGVAASVLSGQSGEGQMQITDKIKRVDRCHSRKLRNRLGLLPVPRYCLPWSISSDTHDYGV